MSITSPLSLLYFHSFIHVEYAVKSISHLHLHLCPCRLFLCLCRCLCLTIDIDINFPQIITITQQNIFLTREGGSGVNSTSNAATTSPHPSPPQPSSHSHTRDNKSQLGSCLQRLQQLEGEKLLLVAAQHMDLIQLHYPAFAPHMGAVGGGGGGDAASASAAATHRAYNTKKKLECEEKIREEMENIMSEKCDLLDIS